MRLTIRAHALREKGWSWPMIATRLEVGTATLSIARREAGLPDPLVKLMEASDRRALARYRAGETVHAIARSRGYDWLTADRAISRARKRERADALRGRRSAARRRRRGLGPERS